ncbi:TonB family protein [Hymenobacter jeollabukensis]|uniref:TonB family protein n=1 Tax=Hymenobacter jeollabukensis TaxID=2025313 RepID=A0A5R8WU70_9BACT|nr:M56 family metallopeptidase [Hymenobacter jeollabukensis]TLM95320.1 TonB family protein [Hymenobacter jeollabukensis]
MTTPTLLSWMWQSTLCLAVSWLFYQLVLRREACFGYNRAFLLLAPVLAAVAPLLPWAQWWPVAAAVRVVGVPHAVLPVLHVGAEAPAASTQHWLPLLYAAGAALSLAGLLWRVGRLLLLARRLPGTKHRGYTLRLTGGQLPTSSFGRTVFWDDTQPLAPAEAAQVLAHELAHVRQGHSADQLWLQLWRAALWFNPLMHLFLRELALTHEYLADAAVLRHDAADPAAAQYARLLARQALRPWQAPALAHAFTTSHTLNRIAMLHRLPLTRAWRKWAALPVAGLLLGLVACEQLASFGPPPPPPPPPAPMAPPPPPPPPAFLGRVLEVADEMPEYQGGMDQLMQDLGALVKYPAAAREARLEGKAFIGFVVDADGSIRDVKLQKAISTSPAKQALADELNDAALRAVRALPGRWTPGRQDGQPVAVAYTIPITFALN